MNLFSDFKGMEKVFLYRKSPLPSGKLADRNLPFLKKRLVSRAEALSG